MTQDDGKTLWCGNLSEKVTDALLYELFLQAGPIEKVYIPRDRDGRQKNFAFVTYYHSVSVPYAIALFKGTSLFNRTLAIQCRAQTVHLPPPIRYDSLDPNRDTFNPTDITAQFSQMTNLLQSQPAPFLDNRSSNILDSDRRQDWSRDRNDRNLDKVHDRLTMASLQGQWSHRHHPYKNERPTSSNYTRGDKDNFSSELDMCESLASNIWETQTTDRNLYDYGKRSGNDNRRDNSRRERNERHGRNWSRRDRNKSHGNRRGNYN